MQLDWHWFCCCPPDVTEKPLDWSCLLAPTRISTWWMNKKNCAENKPQTLINEHPQLNEHPSFWASTGYKTFQTENLFCLWTWPSNHGLKFCHQFPESASWFFATVVCQSQAVSTMTLDTSNVLYDGFGSNQDNILQISQNILYSLQPKPNSNILPKQLWINIVLRCWTCFCHAPTHTAPTIKEHPDVPLASSKMKHKQRRWPCMAWNICKGSSGCWEGFSTWICQSHSKHMLMCPHFHLWHVATEEHSSSTRLPGYHGAHPKHR